ncbi:hypothetical protein M569_10521 [Genlisea aurea]|uniref:Bifunctional inhibitor/plant lipid transfer protein/seed storage helical domain-containing protein n=1 Tax=Genlisea aurea TaxID=192259 RepID=S8CBL8_9LAMI|nr:hypothetical protein M569_10521 [Genlisea aurea]
MAPRFALLLLLLLLGCSCRLISAGDPSRSPCYDPLHSLSACSDYIFPNPAESNAPTNECCSRLESVIRNQPLCLCEVVLTDTFFIQNRAVGLPKACNLTTPPVSLCRGMDGLVFSSVKKFI